jgi:hypothetical protein
MGPTTLDTRGTQQRRRERWLARRALGCKLRLMRLTPLLLFCLGVACSTGRHDVAGSVAASSSSPKPPPLPTQAPIGNDFEPEESTFSLARPDPYSLRLRDALFANDAYRLCQLVTVPSFDRESAVYISVDEGVASVISRTLNEQLWGLMMIQIQIQSGGPKPGKPVDTGPEAQAAALAKIHASADVDRAGLDWATVELLARACEGVLRRTRYQGPSGGVDGVEYHAGHATRGLSLAGRTHSPKPGTIAHDYVILGETLKAFARSTPPQRDAIRAELVAKAERLIDRCGAGR